MKKLTSITLFLLFFITGIYSQTSESPLTPPPVFKHHSVYLELGGNSVLYSFNYDYTISLCEETKLAIGSGFGVNIVPAAPSSDWKNICFLTPSLNLLFGKKSHHVETGVSMILTGEGKAPAIRLGYRYQPVKGGFLFRIGFTPVGAGGIIIPLAGLSFGYTF
jgi:hypothetical protein